jgi:hypothetical protein
MEMMLRKIVLSGFACSVTLLVALNAAAHAAHAEDCKEPKEGSNEAPMLSPPLANVVTGEGRLQFYSAPNARCPTPGVFVIPGDRLIAYAVADNGWSSVTYSNPRTGNVASGWVRSERLKSTGTVGPKQ